MAAIPATVADYAYISSGTWSLTGVVSPTAIVTGAALACNVTNEGGVDGTIRVLKGLTGLWLVQECRRAWNRSGAELSYSQLGLLAGQAPALVSIVYPDDPRFLHPSDMPQAIRDYCTATGQPAPETQGAIVRAALEGLTLNYRLTVEQLETVRGRRVEAIHVVGGGSQNELLCQFTADACDRPVYAGPVEATALGNILAQLLASGDCGSWAETREIARRSTVLREYAPQGHERWDEAFSRFRKLVTHTQISDVGERK